jgi:16S rRNA (adenine1518-N6/adenine1519-N6)-dimethyltransferase
MDVSAPSARKSLGQHFLIDSNIVRKIVALADLTPDETVLEIGPGKGILTEALCRVASRVVAIEVDPRLYAYLAERQSSFPRLELVCGDALTFPTDALPQGTVVVANLPYNISTPLLFRLLDAGPRFSRMVLMLQAEVAARLVARPGTRDYGILSVMAQSVAEITEGFRVSAQCFHPRPEVASAVVLLRRRAVPLIRDVEQDAFHRIVKAAFAHRRKMLPNSLRDEGYEFDQVIEVLQTLGLSTTARAETLSVDQFIQLASRIAK